MNWKMVFKIYVEGSREKKIELTRNRLTNVDDVKFFLTQFFEEQKGWMIEGEKGWGYEIVLVDEYGRELGIKNLNEIMEAREMMGMFSLTSRAVEEILVEGIS